MKRWIIVLLCVAALSAYTKLIWQSGFDQGAAIALCTVASFQQGGDLITLAKDDPACRDANAYEANPLWVLRRRSGG